MHFIINFGLMIFIVFGRCGFIYCCVICFDDEATWFDNMTCFDDEVVGSFLDQIL